MFDPENEEFEAQPFDGQQADESGEEDVSLAGLSAAFAEAIGRNDKEDGREDSSPSDPGVSGAAEADGDHMPPATNDDDEVALVDELPSSYGDQDKPGERADACPVSPQTILESMLFVGNVENRPLSSRRAAELMRDVEPEEIPELVDRLNVRYESNGCPYRIYCEGSGYRLRLCESFHKLRNKFYGRAREARLSQAAIDVLAIVAYRQPITANQVARLRGKPCGHLLAQLVRRRLLRIERPADESNKPVYHTTERFLELFDLDNIDELPQSEGVAT